MVWLWTVLGAVLLLLVGADVFVKLLHPSGRGPLSKAAMESVWWLSRRLARRGAVKMTGPFAVASVVLLWLVLSVLGWALVYLPHMPGSFSFSPGLSPLLRSDVVDAVYLSTVTLGTLGFGDIVPVSTWLRFLVPLQALSGFAVLTAAVTWVLQLYPALGRRRALAGRLSALDRAGAVDQLTALDPSSASALLDGLSAELARMTVDVTHYPETAYFLDADEATSLPAAVHVAQALVEAGAGAAHPDTRLGAAVLGHVLDDFAGVLRHSLDLEGDSTDEVFETYARSHGRD